MLRAAGIATSGAGRGSSALAKASGKAVTGAVGGVVNKVRAGGGGGWRRFILARNVGTTDAEDDAAVPQQLILVQNFFEELKERVPN